MKLKINRQVLLNALNKVSKAVNPKVPLLALTGIKFTLLEDKIELIGSDSDLSIKCIVDKNINNQDVMDIEEYGSVVVPEEKFCEIVRLIESEMIEIEVIDNVAKIRSDKSIFTVNCIPAIDYPSISFEVDEMGCGFELDALELKNTLEQTLFATSDKETRPILTGLNVRCNRDLIECVATDTFRLTKKEIKINDNLTFNVTIPHTSLDVINKIVELGSQVKVNVSDKKVVFNLNNCVITTRVISGTYPDTTRLIPSEFSQVLNISTKELVGAICRASILLSEKNNVVKLNMSNEETYVSSKSSETGNFVEKLNEFSYEGDSLTISFSAKYLLDAIKALGSEEISLCFTGDMKPIIITAKTNPSLIQLILPVRTYD